MVPALPKSWVSTAELEQDVSTNPAWSPRMPAVEAVSLEGHQSLDTVQLSLNRPNPSVRYRTLSGVLGIGMGLPNRTLSNLCAERSVAVFPIAGT